MKNKIFTKVILVVVCVSTLLLTLVVPSFAYSWSSSTASNNDIGYFNLPDSSLVLRRHDYVDIPDYFYLDTSVDVGRGSVVNGSVNYLLPDGRSSNFAILTNISHSTVYDTSYYYGGDFVVWSSYPSSPYAGLYVLDHINYGDVWISEDNTHNFVGTLYNSIEFTFTGTPFYEILDYQTFIPYLLLSYNIDYIDENGILHSNQVNVSTYLEPITLSDGREAFKATVYYLPSEWIGSGGLCVYIQNVDINVYADSDVFIFYSTDATDYTRAICTFANRLVPPSNFSAVVYNDMISNVGDSYYDDGYDEGYDLGYDEGYDVGFDLGYDEGSLNSGSPFDSILLAVDTFINWEFIPGISVGVVLSIVIGVSLLIAFLKIFAGG